MNINTVITALVEYGLTHAWFDEMDSRFIINKLLEVLHLQDFTPVKEEELAQIKEAVEDREFLPVLLKEATNFAVKTGLIGENTIGRRDLFDTKLIGYLLPVPSEINRQFWLSYQESPQIATDIFYQFCWNSNYIRADRAVLDQRWLSPSPYGQLEITINLSKPEKDPRDIAALKNHSAGTSYPPCLLCPSNEGYAGHLSHPARQNLRLIGLNLCGEEWFLQYSPYIYYNEHCIVLSQEHRPMKISEKTFEYLFDFLTQFSHYFIGSNADLPIVGGSILNHDHFQGGRHQFLIEQAQEAPIKYLSNWPQIQMMHVHWPLTTLRLRSKDIQALVSASTHILNVWRDYSFPKCEVLAHTKGTPHNTITPIARRRGQEYEIDLVLRNNRTTQKHPLGIFHPHEEHHHIKKENIGLIEVMGLAVLPGRLLAEVQQIREAVLCTDPDQALQHADLKKHATWVKEVMAESPLTAENFTARIQNAIGQKFCQVLQDCGVFKDDAAGQEGLADFLAKI